MSLLKFFKLPGPSTTVNTLPQACVACGGKELFIQPDFKRSIGLFVVSLASLITVILASMGFGWFVTWSPFFIFLILDRTLNRINPIAVLCYRCEHIHRGAPRKEALAHFEAFDLEINDRYKYADRTINNLP